MFGNLEESYLQLQAGGSVKLRWEKLLDTIGKRIKLSFGQDILEGFAEGVDDDGNLILILENGESLTVNAGDNVVRILPPLNITIPEINKVTQIIKKSVQNIDKENATKEN